MRRMGNAWFVVVVCEWDRGVGSGGWMDDLRNGPRVLKWS